MSVKTREIYELSIGVSAEDTDDILLEAARELYRKGELEIVRKFDTEFQRDRNFVNLRMWKDVEEEQTTTETITNATTSSINEYIEDEHNPNGILSKLTRFLG